MVSFTRNTNATDVAIYLQRSLNLVSNVWNGIATNTAGSWNPPGIATETGTGNPVDVEITNSHTNAAYYRLPSFSPEEPAKHDQNSPNSLVYKRG